MRLNNFKYKYLSALLVGLILAVFLAENESFKTFLHQLGTLEYLGAFFSGVLFVSSFTVATSIVIISILTNDIHPLWIAIIGGFGSVLGDLLIFRFVKNHLGDELKLLFGKTGTTYVKHVFKSRYIAWLLPIFGALIIASPLPDELGVSLLGLTEISQKKLIVISYISNFFGILAIAAVSKIV